MRSAATILAMLFLCAASSAPAQNRQPVSIASSAPFAYWTVNSSKPRVALLLIHGFGLHKGAFDAFARRMQKEGIASYAVDLRGFGDWRTERLESHELHFDQSLIDIGSALLWIKKMHPGVPVVLVGESMGGAFALNATALYPDLVDGLVASVPSREFFGKKKTAMRALCAALRPDTKLDMSKEIVHKATEDAKLRKTWEDDPDARLQVSPKELLKFEIFVKQTAKRADEITNKPVLMLHGSDDRLAKQNGTIELFNQLGTADKELTMLAAEHLIVELGQFDEQAVQIVLDWLNRHYSPGKIQNSSTNNP